MKKIHGEAHRLTHRAHGWADLNGMEMQLPNRIKRELWLVAVPVPGTCEFRFLLTGSRFEAYHIGRKRLDYQKTRAVFLQLREEMEKADPMPGSGSDHWLTRNAEEWIAYLRKKITARDLGWWAHVHNVPKRTALFPDE